MSCMRRTVSFSNMRGDPCAPTMPLSGLVLIVLVAAMIALTLELSGFPRPEISGPRCFRAFSAPA